MGSACCCAPADGATSVELANADDSKKEKKGVKFGGGEDGEDDVELISEDSSDYDSEYGYSKSDDLEEVKRNKRRNQTFYLLNDTDKKDDARRSWNDAMRMQHSASTVSEAEDKSEAEKVKDEMLHKVEDFVDKAYDILPAEMCLADVEKLVTEDEWRQIQMTPLFDRFCRKLDYFYDVGISCCQKNEDWLEVYNSGNGMQTIHGLIDPNDNHVLYYRVRAHIPTKLTHVMAVANEIQLMPIWNSLVVKDPEVIGRRTAHYMVLNYQISALAGMYKVDVLNEIRRFSDVNGGFLAEYIMSVAKDHPSYKEPEKGYKRMQTEMKNVICACGEDNCVLIQVGKIKLPFSASKWLAKTIGQVAGKFIVGALVNNSLRAKEPGNPWEAPMAEDKLGLYHRLAECIRAPGSVARDPGKGDSIPEFELEHFFSSRRFYRKSARRSRIGLPVLRGSGRTSSKEKPMTDSGTASELSQRASESENT
mmetsp:Transcript_30119/g.54757  ORF Transcript_30119/g.54757 Transcript_30119/m.54757 type:complete len:478 (-) Transcript_30119:66-1499(-)